MLFVALLAAIMARDHKILVLLGSKREKQEFSTFLGEVKKFSSDITYKYTSEDQINLERFGLKVYDTVIIIAQKDSCLGPNSQALTHFIDNGGNAIVFAYDSGDRILRTVASHLEVRISDSFTDVLNHKKVVLRNIVAPEAIVSKPCKPLIYEGGYTVIDRPNDFRMPIVVGGLEHRNMGSNKRITHIAKEIIPICAFQARTAGRVVLIPSFKFASNEFLEEKITINPDMSTSEEGTENGNLELLVQLLEWVTDYKSFIHLKSATHFSQETGVAPVQYHCKENITVVAELEYSKNGEMVPFEDEDVQVEIFMLGTFVRHHMKHIGNGKFTDTFTIPDRLGNYKVKVFTNRFGWRNAREEMAIAVRGISIREQEHFLKCAEPYQAAMIVIMIGAFLSVVHFLYHKPSSQSK